MDEFGENVSLRPVYLGVADLYELEQVLKEGMESDPQPEHYAFLNDNLERNKFSVEVKDGPRTIRASSISELLSKKLPKTTKELNASVFVRDSDRMIKASATVALYDYRGYFSVSARSEPEFLGKKQQLLEFFRARRPWYAPLVVFAPFLSLVLGLPAGVISIVSAVNGRFDFAIALGLVSLVSITIFVLIAKGRLFRHSKVVLEESKSGWGKMEVMALIGLVFNAISIVLWLLSDPW